MCPDRELLSAYVDGEVPSPWNERVAEHLTTCRSCASVVAGYASLARRLEEAPCPDEAAIVARCRERLELDLGRRGESAHWTEVRGGAWRRSGYAWRRSVSLPLPLAAAAALALLLLAGLSTANLLSSGRAAKPVLAAAEVVPNGAQQVSMDNVLRFLDSQNAQVTVTINLPSETTFSEPGTPVIVRAPRGASKGDGTP